MEERIKLFLAGICGSLAALAENYGVILLLCCAFILIDLATGLVKAKIQGRLSSDTPICALSNWPWNHPDRRPESIKLRRYLSNEMVDVRLNNKKQSFCIDSLKSISDLFL